MYIYVCVYIHINKYITCSSARPTICSQGFKRKTICMHMYMYVCVCTCIYMCVYIYIIIYICVCVYTYIYIYHMFLGAANVLLTGIQT